MDTTITQAIVQKILEWPGVTTEPNRFGGIEFLVDNKEMGHIHGERLADLPFPVKIRECLIGSDKHCLITFIQSPAGLAIGFEIQEIYQQ